MLPNQNFKIYVFLCQKKNILKSNTCTHRTHKFRKIQNERITLKHSKTIQRNPNWKQTIFSKRITTSSLTNENGKLHKIEQNLIAEISYANSELDRQISQIAKSRETQPLKAPRPPGTPMSPSKASGGFDDAQVGKSTPRGVDWKPDGEL